MAQQDLRVVVLGAGMAGILAGIKLLERGYRDITLYEKADRVGGTWRENTYPGLTCDVPSHHYTYSFERNPDWTRHLPPGAEIQSYFERTTEKYGLYDVIRFNEEATSARFENGRWHLGLRSGRQDVADVLIAATGVLHKPRFPDIKGADTFTGHLFHSARWDHSVDLDGKRIGVIGNGSTGVQIISALAGRAAKIEHYQRTAQWIMPVENGYFSDEERAAFRDPAVLEQAMQTETYMAGVERYTEAVTDMESEGAREMAAICLANLENNVQDPALREKLRPDHAPLCKRLIFSPDYYQAIQHPNAALVTEGIECIEPSGIRTRDGELHELDIIVFATGFHPDCFMRPMTITGRNGADLEDLWHEKPLAYLAISMPDFPNLFMLNGPSGPVGNFSLIDIAENQWGYIEQLMDRIRSGECQEIAPTRDALAAYEASRVEAAKQTVWFRGGCNSWYLDKQGVPASWPWNYSRFVDMMTTPDWRAFGLATPFAPKEGAAVAN
ncbi:flavin-containing monooxygenase [Parahaliea mediterranea]|uniref:NAD(P)/FAD-dependent oxidoreductase n=1 Tax=Parahaliea mediterranea TaxID=651086 RepID=A0A939DF38_9GAMM|nr:NAD(P)/FAD-dependent oxidoreductase [Parahaliea mediterranea]MBN7796721.1 NAD(P)/FAD-dependent oxidoreductase [Parahaliea mediterranea]